MIAVAIILLLCLIALLALRTSYVQNFAKNKVMNVLSKQYQADFSIGHIYFNGFDVANMDQILFRDQRGDTLLYAEHLKVDIGLFSLIDKHVWLDEITITNIRSKIYEIGNDSMNFTFLIPAKDTIDSPADESKWKFGLSDVIINNPNILYKTETQQFDITDKKLVLEFDQFDLEKRFFEVDLLQSNDLYVLFKTLKESENTDEAFALPYLDWNFIVNEFKLSKGNFQSIGLKDSIDITRLSAQLEKSQFHKGKLTTNIKKLNGNYNNIISLSNAQGIVILDSLNGQIQQFNLKTVNDDVEIDLANYSFIDKQLNIDQIDLNLSYGSIKLLENFIPDNINIQPNTPISLKAAKLIYDPSSINIQNIDLTYGSVIKTSGDFKMENLGEVDKTINATITNISSNLSALDRVLKDLTIPKDFSIYKNISGTASASGSLKNLKIHALDLNVDRDIRLRTNGYISNLTDIDQLNFDLKIAEFKANAKRLPIPPNDKVAIDSLGQMSFAGSIVGNLKSLKIDGLLRSDLGSLKSDIKMVIPKNMDDLAYKGKLMLQDFRLGTLIRNNEVGMVSFDVNLDGKGTTLPTLNSKIDGVISAFTFRDYTYNNVLVDAKISESTIDGKLNLNDDLVKLAYEGQIILKDQTAIFNFDLTVDTLKLQELDLMDRPLYVSGQIHSAFQIPISATQNSVIKIKNFNFSNPNQSFHSDSIEITGVKNLDTVLIKMNSNFGHLDLKGIYTIKDLPKALTGFLNHHWPTDSMFVNKTFSSENLQITGTLSTIQPLAVFLQDTLLQVGRISVDLSTSFADYATNGSIIIDSLIHNDILIEQLTGNAITEDGKIYFNLQARNNILKGRKIDLVALDNLLTDKKITSTFLAKDGDDIPRLKFELLTTQGDQFLNISMKDSFILNQKDWLVDEKNNIRIYKDRFFIDRFAITDQNEFLTVQSSNDGNNINVNFKNFEVGQFTTLMTLEPSKFTGKVNGDLDVNDMRSNPYFITNLKIDNMVYDSTAVGELVIAANVNPNTKLLTTDFTLIGPTNDVKGGGTYNISNKSANFQIDLNSLDMLILNPFLSEIMVDSKGTLSGNASLTGSLDKPVVKGVLTFDTVTTTIVANNARYQIDDHTITFDNNTFDIGNLKIKDDEGNTASLTGKINHNFLEQFYLDVALKTDKFTFLNTTAEDNPVFFGKVILDARATIKGNPAKLNVEVVATTLKNSTITLSPFASEKVLIEEQFITYGKPEDFKDLTNEYLLKLNRLFPFDVNLLLNATKDANFTFVIDPISGDKIKAIGSGNLNVKLKPDGSQEIFGIYTADKGTYDFSYGDFVSKKFTVKPGGTVRFEGNPLSAVLDIDAVYDVYTSTYELIKNEVAISESETAAAKRRTNVKVSLSLEGTLLNPNIALNIEVPDLQSTNLITAIDRKLTELRNNPNELNNQVFGLLIFDSFILSDNVSSGFDNLGNNIALKSLSSLVSNQLNRFASQVVKGVDIDVNVNSYESGYVDGNTSGNVTEVGLKVSKQLFNDRLSFSAGGNLDINQGNTSAGYSSFIGDFVLNYKLTDDGRYQIKVFSKSDYDRLLNANTNRNGISIFFNQSFDSKTDGKK